MFLTENDYRGVRFTYEGRSQARFCDASETYVAHIPSGRTMRDAETALRLAGYPMAGDDRSWNESYATIDRKPFATEAVECTPYALHKVTITHPYLD